MLSLHVSSCNQEQTKPESEFEMSFHSVFVASRDNILRYVMMQIFCLLHFHNSVVTLNQDTKYIVVLSAPKVPGIRKDANKMYNTNQCWNRALHDRTGTAVVFVRVMSKMLNLTEHDLHYLSSSVLHCYESIAVFVFMISLFLLLHLVISLCPSCFASCSCSLQEVLQEKSYVSCVHLQLSYVNVEFSQSVLSVHLSSDRFQGVFTGLGLDILVIYTHISCSYTLNFDL